MKCLHGIIFDLDGTLIDSLIDVSFAANQVLMHHGFTPLAKNDYRHIVGEGSYVLMEKASKSSDRAYITQMALEFAEVYHTSPERAVPYEGIIAMLDTLRQLPLKIAILSNKPDALTKQCVKHHFPTYPFHGIHGHKEGEILKPNPLAALAIATEWEISPHEILFIGDTHVDMQTAHNASMYSMGVTWGFRDEEELRLHGAHYIVHKPSDIISLLSTLRTV